jgi:peptide methionine sulfoxide reductase msrA/msrB
MVNAPKVLTVLVGSVGLLLCLAGCRVESELEGHASRSPAQGGAEPAPAGSSRATFAGGCFWCVEKPFEDVPGVSAVISGYTGGHLDDPTYAQVSSGGTGHTEAVQIHYDPSQVSYEDLLQIFWRQIDPTDGGGQFVDRGDQYRSEIFVHNSEQRVLAESSRAALEASGRYAAPIATGITDVSVYYPAEDYHQDFYIKSPERYHSYRAGSGRDRYLDRVWGDDRVYEVTQVAPLWSKPGDAVLREKLSPLQYRVTQKDGTERAFDNAYWDHDEEGIYVDVVSGEPLFSSMDKFKSGTGWPSFTKPLVSSNIMTGQDFKLGYPRDEVRSRIANSHLGHVFDDGPAPSFKRYCMNSAALRFIPHSELELEGYAEFASLFTEPGEQ